MLNNIPITISLVWFPIFHLLLWCRGFMKSPGLIRLGMTGPGSHPTGILHPVSLADGVDFLSLVGQAGPRVGGHIQVPFRPGPLYRLIRLKLGIF